MAGSTVAWDDTELVDFHTALTRSRRIVAVLGAGLSVASGLPTYRGAGSAGLWRNHDATQIATPAAFRHDPGLVWQYTSHMRRLALAAAPNPAHYALAELARRVPGFITLSQNIDNLSPRAGHPSGQLKLLHGNLFDLRCADNSCGYIERGNFKDPITPALAPLPDQKTSAATGDGKHDTKRPKATAWLLEGIARKNRQILGSGYQESANLRADQAALKKSGDDGDDGGKESVEARMAVVPEPSNLSPADLPQCPQCTNNNLLRPNIVWFGEALPADLMAEVDAMFSDDAEPIDLCLVIGTSGGVWPAAGFASLARKKGARIATVNIDVSDVKNGRSGIDWVFAGDAAAIVPRLLEPLIKMSSNDV
jgi:NAD+-dependent protein deacetylase sirtuin 5